MKVFHHNDNDGKCAAAIVYLYEKFVMNNILKKEDFICCDYVKTVPLADLIEEGEVVYIVDYSFGLSTVNKLTSIIVKAGKVCWYDHHKTSFELEKMLMDMPLSLMAVLDGSKSGAMIAYDNLIKGTKLDTDFLSKTVAYVDDYDRWIHQYPESLLYNIGSTLFDTHPMSDIWVCNPESIYKKGELIKKYNDNKNSRLTKDYGFLIKINGHFCIVLNTPEASSQAFAEYYDQFKFAMRYAFNGEKFVYSVYSTLEDIDCEKIAKYFNPTGGGHKTAAGFTSETHILYSGTEYNI